MSSEERWSPRIFRAPSREIVGREPRRKIEKEVKQSSSEKIMLEACSCRADGEIR